MMERSALLCGALLTLLLGSDPIGGVAVEEVMRPGTALDQRMPAILHERNVAGAGVAIIENGEIARIGYYGEQGPGIAVTAETRFNTASVAKTVTAETVLRIASRGQLNLDERLSRHFVLNALADDPRHRLLTPVRVLSHQAGLRNWPGSYEDGKMAFIATPGTAFSYSGMAYEMLALFLQNKLDESFDDLVEQFVFEPTHITNASVKASACREPRAAVPMNVAGEYVEACSNLAPGEWSAADNLYVTVEDYARFMIAVMNDAGLTNAVARRRNRIQVSLLNDPVWHCEETSSVRCPDEYGYGLGWMIYRYGDATIFQHGGNDFGESALVYFEKNTRNGAVIFINGGNGFLAIVDVLELLGQQPALAAYYRQLAARHYGTAAK